MTSDRLAVVCSMAGATFGTVSGLADIVAGDVLSGLARLVVCGCLVWTVLALLEALAREDRLHAEMEVLAARIDRFLAWAWNSIDRGEDAG